MPVDFNDPNSLMIRVGIDTSSVPAGIKQTEKLLSDFGDNVSKKLEKTRDTVNNLFGSLSQKQVVDVFNDKQLTSSLASVASGFNKIDNGLRIIGKRFSDVTYKAEKFNRSLSFAEAYNKEITARGLTERFRLERKRASNLYQAEKNN